jgi:hypothetical protein
MALSNASSEPTGPPADPSLGVGLPRGRDRDPYEVDAVLPPVPTDYDHRADAVDARFLLCRLIGHGWTPDDESDWFAQYGHYGIALVCSRCGMERRDSFDVAGRLNGRSYAQPEGYRIPSDETPTREAVRTRYAAEAARRRAARGARGSGRRRAR